MFVSPLRIDRNETSTHCPDVLRLLPFALLILSLTPLEAETAVEKSPPPAWVVLPEYEIPTKTDPSLGSVRYLASDLQSNLEESTDYKHFATQINTRAGVEDYSQISVDFQPDYQTLTWHSLKVLRDGEIQDRLPGVTFELMRQEKGLDRQLYDGETTAHAILNDIRPGDTIVYSYSIAGANPIFRGKTHAFLRTEFSDPLDYSRCRILWDSSLRTLRWRHNKAFPTELTHSEKAVGALDVLLFEKRGSKGIDVETRVPSSVPTHPFIEYSDYTSWEEFGKWTESIFLTGEPLPESIRAVCEEIRERKLTPDETALAVLRWVQENVRYLGSFMGEHTHAPYTLEQISERRFGDCKDKGMLVTAMLVYLGLDAAPALVDTNDREGIAENFPGFRNFNHLIVHLKLDGADYWLDPTRTFQRGTLANSYSPAYGFAFAIRPGAKELTPVEPAGFGKTGTAITESFVIPDMSGNATMHVHTVATGRDADALRHTFASDSLSEIEEDYCEYYEDDYPGIKVAAPMTFTDDEKRNRIVITESYNLTDLWQKETGKGEPDQLYAWFYARFISSNANVPSDTERKLPYSISHPKRYVHTFKITPPDGWDFPEGEHSRKLPALNYTYTISSVAGKARVSFEYFTRSDRVLPEDFAAYREAMKLFEDDLYYYLSSPIIVTEGGGEVGKSYGFVTGFLILGLLAGITACVVIWFWDPAPRPKESGSRNLHGIGGWMILPMLQCLALPFICIYEISTFYTVIDADTFTLFSGFENENTQRIAFACGIFFSACILMVSLLQLKLLYSHRTSFPLVFIVLGVVIFSSDILYLYFSEIASGEDASSEGSRGITRSISGLIIWTIYMLVSNRVKTTFIRRRKKPEPIPQPPPLPA